MPFCSVTFTMANAGAALVTWNLAVPMNGGLVTRLNVDGNVIAPTNMVIGNTIFVTSTGMYFAGPLASGTHTVTLEYRTDRPFTYDPTTDWQASRLQVLSYDH